MRKYILLYIITKYTTSQEAIHQFQRKCQHQVDHQLLYNVIIIIIYHDSFHQGGVVMSSQLMLTIINIHPLAHILNNCALIFSSCALFTVYPNSIMKLHHIPLQVITKRAREGGPKEHRAKQNWQRETHSVTYEPGLSISTLSDLSRIDVQPPASGLSNQATFTPPIQPNLGLPLLTSATNTLLAMR